MTKNRTVWLVCLGILGVFFVHIGLFFALYRTRVLHSPAYTESDALVFGAPFLLAVSGYFFLLRLLFPQRRSIGQTVTLVVVALVGAVLSGLLAMSVAFNIYGT